MLTALIDYESGNLHSAQKAFERMATEASNEEVIVTSDPDMLRRADRLVLPGDGAFPACKAALVEKTGLYDALLEAVKIDAKPFLGICVGMQMMASFGHEYQTTKGLDWIAGDIEPIEADRSKPESATYGLERSGDYRNAPGTGGAKQWRSRLFCAFLSLYSQRPGAQIGACGLWRCNLGDLSAPARASACSFIQKKAKATGPSPNLKFSQLAPLAARLYARRDPMILYPAIDLKDGQAVRLYKRRNGQGDCV